MSGTVSDTADDMMRETPANPASLRPARRELLLGGLFAATAAITFARMPRRHIVAVDRAGFQQAIPNVVGPWHVAQDGGFVLPPEDEQKAASVYQDQLTRSFTDGASAPIMLLIAYDRSQSGMLMIHRPESCYPGSGFTIMDERAVPLPLASGVTANAKFLSARRDTRIEQVLYWTRLGNSFPLTWAEQRSAIAGQNLRGTVPDGALVRMSMIDPDPDASLATMRHFAVALFAASPPSGRALLAGPANVHPA